MARPVARSVSMPRSMAYLAISTAMGPVSAIMSAIFRHSARSISGEVTLFTRPISKASSAFTRRPVKISSLALATPIIRGRRWVPPPPGIMARRVSVRPMEAVSEAMRMSEARATSVPPPRATPFTAEITGMGRFWREVSRFLMVRMNFFTSSGVRLALSFKSAPAQKDFSPLPVMMTVRLSVRYWRESMVSLMAYKSSKLRQFITSGRFRVRITAWFFSSIRRRSWVMVISQKLSLASDIARNNNALDFRGSLADFKEFLIPVEPFHIVFLHEPVSAVDLDGMVNNPRHDLGAIELAHGGLF